MANVSIVLIVVAILGCSAASGTGPRERRLKEKLNACREQHGSHWYYMEHFDYCCPCTSCNDQSGRRLGERTWECLDKAERECKTRYSGQCRYLSFPSKTLSTSAGVNVTTVSSTSKSSLQNDGLSVEIVIIVSVAVFCAAVLLACACCLASRTHVCGLLKKVGRSKLQSHSKSSKSKNYGQESGGSAESKTLIQENAESRNEIQPSFSDSNYTDSIESGNGPPGIMTAQLVRHASQESDYSSENSRADMADSTAGSRTQRALIRSEMPQNGFSIRDCNGIGVIAAPHSQVVIHNLTVGGNAERCDFRDNARNHLHRVEPQPTAPATKTFSTLNGINGNRRDRNLHRQSSEMSSASSGPVENETCPAAVWQLSDARQDQISALETYSQDSCGRASGPALQNGGASYRRLNSDMSSCSSRSTQSSGLPPECDMEPFAKHGRV